ncbi:MAG: DoxX family protein [Verrucomicrobiota bacterium]|nr:DoxX family protein [Verrucomicrobiota bacterium]
MWTSLNRYREAALLFLRVALGAFFIYVHGWPKLAGGITRWKIAGDAMRHAGITFAPEFWGFMAAFAESIGCAFFVLGLFFRPACLLLVITMTMASLTELNSDARNPLLEASHAIELGIVFFALLFVGPGKYSFDKS